MHGQNYIKEIQVVSSSFEVTSLTIHALHRYSSFTKTTRDIHRNCT